MVIDQAFWKDKTVFLTGHTGFKGSWISLWLSQLGAKVVGFSLEPPTVPSLFEEANIKSVLFKNIIADIRDPDALNNAIQQVQPEIVIHMAAQSLVKASYEDPVDTYSTNVMGLVNLLQASRFCSSIKVLLNITSDKCYENNEWPWGYREIDPLGGFDPYSSSKGCAEIISSAFRQSYLNEIGIAVATARAGNVIGGGDWAHNRIVPDAIRAFSNSSPLIVRNPLATRPWQHVLEPLNGYLLLCQRLYEQPANYSQAWNFGPYDQGIQPVSTLVELLVEAWGEGAYWQLDNNAHPHEAQSLKLDCSKAITQLKWKPSWDLKTTVHETVKWYKCHDNKENVQEFMKDQIYRFSLDGSKNE